MSPAKTKHSAATSHVTATPKTVFYARVSTRDQKLDLQVEAARKLGIPTENIFVEKASGVRHDRPVLEKALAALSPGDTLAAYKLDRIGRSLAHVTKLLADLEVRGVHFRTIDDGISTKGPTGRMVLHMLGAVAQFERDLILERTRAGIEAAKKNGKKMGRTRKRSAELAKQAQRYMLKDGLNADDTARVLKVSRRTMFRALKEAREHDALVSAGE